MNYIAYGVALFISLILPILLSILVIILLTVSAYAWMQTEPSLGENIEYNRDFYVTDSDIQVKLYALIDNKYVLQGQYSDDELLNLEFISSLTSVNFVSK